MLPSATSRPLARRRADEVPGRVDRVVGHDHVAHAELGHAGEERAGPGDRGLLVDEHAVHVDQPGADLGRGHAASGGGRVRVHSAHPRAPRRTSRGGATVPSGSQTGLPRRGLHATGRRPRSDGRQRRSCDAGPLSAASRGTPMTDSRAPPRPVLRGRDRPAPRPQGRLLPERRRQPRPRRGAARLRGPPLLRRSTRRWIVDDLALEPYTGDAPGPLRDPHDGRPAPAGRTRGRLPLRAGGRGLHASPPTAWRAPTARSTTRCSCRSSTAPPAPRATGPGATSTSSPRTTTPGRSTSTSPTTRHASTTRGYSCPLTPEENRLPIRVEAGERLAPGDH